MDYCIQVYILLFAEDILARFGNSYVLNIKLLHQNWTDELEPTGNLISRP